MTRRNISLTRICSQGFTNSLLPETVSVSSFRIPNCFLLIGGIIAVLSVLGLLLVREPEKERKTEEKLLDDSELPSLNAKEVLRTALFYKVALSTNNLIEDNKPLLVLDLVRLFLSLWNSGIY